MKESAKNHGKQKKARNRVQGGKIRRKLKRRGDMRKLMMNRNRNRMQEAK